MERTRRVQPALFDQPGNGVPPVLAGYTLDPDESFAFAFKVLEVFATRVEWAGMPDTV